MLLLANPNNLVNMFEDDVSTSSKTTNNSTKCDSNRELIGSNKSISGSKEDNMNNKKWYDILDKDLASIDIKIQWSMVLKSARKKIEANIQQVLEI